MNDREYWRQRAELLEELTYGQSMEAAQRIKAEYNAAIREIDKEIENWYRRYAKEEKISYAEAKRRLTGEELASLKMDVKEYVRKGKTLNYSQQYADELRRASTAHHISRLEELRIRTTYRIEIASGMEMEITSKALKDAYESRFYREAYEIQKARRGGQMIIESNVSKRLRSVMNRPWTADDRTFSARIWANRDRLINNVLTELTQGIIAGRPLDDIAKRLDKTMGTGFSNAYRLVRTEAAHFAEEATYDSYKELDVERYQILATLDDRTSDICQEMDGQIFRLSEKSEGETYPPFHVNCRTTTIPADEIDPDETRLAKGDDGKWVSIPANITYKEWRETMVG
jgi:SPP1 gp7 family putative phage head morphogenesis protein